MTLTKQDRLIELCNDFVTANKGPKNCIPDDIGKDLINLAKIIMYSNMVCNNHDHVILENHDKNSCEICEARKIIKELDDGEI